MPLSPELFDRQTAGYLSVGLACLLTAPRLPPAGGALLLLAAGRALERAAATRAVAGLYRA